MSLPESTSRNGNSNTALSQSNVSQVPLASRNSVDRYARAPVSDGPYYAGARAEDRNSHLAGLSSQVKAMDEILKSRS
ncbi:hypothetical protein N7488_009264 [Penicillium malachiteum]|nr:hypothetical protein N7488_009264 [Penicillium malachiteum]